MQRNSIRFKSFLLKALSAPRCFYRYREEKLRHKNLFIARRKNMRVYQFTRLYARFSSVPQKWYRFSFSVPPVPQPSKNLYVQNTRILNYPGDEIVLSEDPYSSLRLQKENSAQVCKNRLPRNLYTHLKQDNAF